MYDPGSVKLTFLSASITDVPYRRFLVGRQTVVEFATTWWLPGPARSLHPLPILRRRPRLPVRQRRSSCHDSRLTQTCHLNPAPIDPPVVGTSPGSSRPRPRFQSSQLVPCSLALSRRIVWSSSRMSLPPLAGPCFASRAVHPVHVLQYGGRP